MNRIAAATHNPNLTSERVLSFINFFQSANTDWDGVEHMPKSAAVSFRRSARAGLSAVLVGLTVLARGMTAWGPADDPSGGLQ
jgi:hypothetical protein